MMYNVAQLLKDQVGATRRFEIEEAADYIQEVQATAPYTGHAKLTHINQAVLVEASVSTTVEVLCNRCLKPVRVPISVEFTEEFKPAIDIATGLPVESPAGEEYFGIDEHHVLDLTEAVRQYIVTEWPQFALCREACLGLCPVCGHDLNEGPCDCQPQAGDPRLAVLGKLLGNSERS